MGFPPQKNKIKGKQMLQINRHSKNEQCTVIQALKKIE